MIYLRQHWTMQAIAECVEVAESTVFNYIHEMLPYIEATLPCQSSRAVAARMSRV